MQVEDDFGWASYQEQKTAALGMLGSVGLPDEGLGVSGEIGGIRAWSDIPTLQTLPRTPISWLAEGLVARGEVTLITGQPGHFKSWIAAILARSVVSGRPFLGRRSSLAPVVYLDRENPDETVAERADILGITNEVGIRYWGGWCEEPPPMIGDFRYLQFAKEFKPLMIFDSLIDFHKAKENDASEMTPIMQVLRELANAGASPFVLHHVGRAEGKTYRGTEAIEASVDRAMKVAFDENTKIVSLKSFKTRRGKAFSLTLQPNFGEFGPGDDFVVSDNPEREAARTQTETVRSLILQFPGITKTKLIKLAGKNGMSEGRTETTLRAHVDRLWSVEVGLNNSRCYRAIEARL